MVAGQFFLWPGAALYAGTGMDSTSHRHYMLQIGLSLEGPFEVNDLPMSGFLVSRNTSHYVSAAGRVGVFIWTDPDNPRGRRLRQVLADNGTSLLPLNLNVPGIAVDGTLDCKGARELRERILNAIAPLPAQTLSPDTRIPRLMALIGNPEYLHDLSSVEQLAGEVNLSSSWLRHVFRKHTGLSIQQYILWSRVRRAVECMSAWTTITEVAHEAGFADAAHLSRTFRNSFGLAPSDVFSMTTQAVLCQE
jgi:AraC-like DNA-binding protein